MESRSSSPWNLPPIAINYPGSLDFRHGHAPLTFVSVRWRQRII
jgi:hypothetical protein